MISITIALGILLPSQSPPDGEQSIIDRIPSLRLVLEWELDSYPLHRYDDIESICTSIVEENDEIDNEMMVEILLRRGKARSELKKYKGALDDFRAVLSHRPDNLYARYGQAAILLSSANATIRDQGIREIHKLIEDFPDSPYGYNLLGVIYHRANDFDSAIESYSKAIERDKSFGPAYINRAPSYLMTDQPEKALRDLQQALTISPGIILNKTGVFDLQGSALMEMGRYKEAFANYLQAHRQRPAQLATLLQLWKLSYEEGKYGRCLHFSEKLLTAAPEDSSALQIRAASLSQIGRHDDGLRVLRKVLENEPTHPFVRGQMAMMHMQSGEYAKASELFKEVLEEDPDNVNNILRYSFLLSTCPDNHIRNGETAAKFAKKALSNMKPSLEQAVAKMVLALAYAEKGQQGEAVETAMSAVKDYLIHAEMGHLEWSERWKRLIVHLKMGQAYRHKAKSGERSLFEIPILMDFRPSVKEWWE